MNLLHIVGSPRKESSISLNVACHFIERWTAIHPGSNVDTLDVWTTNLPAFDAPALDAKYAGLAGKTFTAQQRQVWSEIRVLSDRFHLADIIVISVPMWNFGIPYRLKHLIDAVSQKDLLFTFDGHNLKGSLVGRKAVVIAARGAQLGGDYPEKEYDHQTAYLRTWFRMVGIANLYSLSVEGTLSGPEVRAAIVADARKAASDLAGKI
jgi:FMN-dependent NADH-azoreductase